MKNQSNKHTKIKMKKKEKTKVEKKPEEVGTLCNDKNCPVHGFLKIRGKTFEGVVISKHLKRVAIEFERMVYVRKYERYARYKTRIHARISPCMEKDVSIGDLIKIQECRPLSKIIHFVVIGKVNNGEKEK